MMRHDYLNQSIHQGMIKNPEIIERFNFKIVYHNDLTWKFQLYGIKDAILNAACA